MHIGFHIFSIGMKMVSILSSVETATGSHAPVERQHVVQNALQTHRRSLCRVATWNCCSLVYIEASTKGRSGARALKKEHNTGSGAGVTLGEAGRYAHWRRVSPTIQQRREDRPKGSWHRNLSRGIQNTDQLGGYLRQPDGSYVSHPFQEASCLVCICSYQQKSDNRSEG